MATRGGAEKHAQKSSAYDAAIGAQSCRQPARGVQLLEHEIAVGRAADATLRAQPRVGCVQAAVRCGLAMRLGLHNQHLRLRIAVRPVQLLPDVSGVQ